MSTRRFRTYHEVGHETGSRILEQVVQQRQRLADRLRGIRCVIAVLSGKGGVGKSAITANLAAVLADRGARVGAVDADLNGPSLARMLGSRYSVTPVDGGKEALELLESDPAFDVILCDLMMPQITGMELHDQVRAIDPALADKVVFMTGDAFTDAARAFVATVPNRVLDKPFEPRELRALIAECVK